ncbi:glycosyltransferase [Propionibacterium freudenreichii]|uniref:glycosyltransferase n=2 Tax=Propionibacterium freudenreichii TaxID=1744 RepID=UPI000BC3657C|nr:glycosyltransferase [Propionibacterium freudenreichii]MDK9346591.1 glycosyltransferase [Propionibacterium freudenreichii]MDK9353877.1 glycosyltransferase [Propionibacterium freudenreichii]MDK9647457.1 glycosyltransferase [Propionibacterium freudenreichii]MDK9655155.1 glycosyltransferase [Propionibacterium freudenreichii]MDK9667570.1 glycosyltransferase [Propionibacterium freudenreichii]
MGEGLRIGFVSLHTSPIASPGSADAGGMNVVELNAALALAAAGHQVDLITRRDHPGEPAVEQLAEGVRLLNLDAGPPHPMAKSASEELIEPFRAAMARLPGNYDVIHSHHWFSGVAALPLARQWRLPHVQSFHSVAAPSGSTSLADGEPAESPGRVAGEALSARESDLVIAVSHAERRAVELRYHRFDGIDVVHPGVDTEQFHPLREGQRHWAWDDTGGCYFLFAARLQPLKGPDLAIRMMAEIPEYDRPQLIVAGEASADFADYEASLHALVGELGLTDKVTFLGSQSRDELASMLRGACALINPSYSETFGIICLEAEASGVPPIAARTGGIPEAVLDGKTGILLDDRDPASWAAAAQSVRNDGALRQRLTSAAREFACQHTWTVMAQGLEDSYRRVIAAFNEGNRA